MWDVHKNRNVFLGLTVCDIHTNGNDFLGFTVWDVHTYGNVFLGFTMWDVHTYGNDWVSMPRPIAHDLILPQPFSTRINFFVVRHGIWQRHRSWTAKFFAVSQLTATGPAK